MMTMTPTCAHEGCSAAKKPGKSKYCPTHAREARENWKTNIAAQAEARAERDAEFAQLHRKADAAGRAAAEAAVPAPMVVQSHANQLNDSSPVTQAWYVSEGACGFGWVLIRPGNCPFANYAKKHLGARAAYHGGVSMWSPLMTQSMARNEAWARAYADVLREAGITAYGQSRMD